MKTINRLVVETLIKMPTLCPLCQMQLKTKINLRKHLKNNNTINVEKSSFVFTNVEHFNEWKIKEIESRYTKSVSSNFKNIIREPGGILTP